MVSPLNQKGIRFGFSLIILLCKPKGPAGRFGRNPMFSPSVFRETIRGMVSAIPARFSSYYDVPFGRHRSTDFSSCNPYRSRSPQSLSRFYGIRHIPFPNIHWIYQTGTWWFPTLRTSVGWLPFCWPFAKNIQWIFFYTQSSHPTRQASVPSFPQEAGQALFVGTGVWSLAFSISWNFRTSPTLHPGSSLKILPRYFLNARSSHDKPPLWKTGRLANASGHSLSWFLSGTPTHKGYRRSRHRFSPSGIIWYLRYQMPMLGTHKTYKQ